MAAPSPQEKINELNNQFHELLSAFSRTHLMNELAFARLENEFKLLCALPQFEGGARVSLSQMYALKGDKERFLHNISRAELLLGGANESVRTHKAHGYLYLWEINAAAELVLDKSDESSPEGIRSKRYLCLNMGLFEKAYELTNVLAKMQLDVSAPSKVDGTVSIRDEFERAVSIMRERGITDKDLSMRIQVAANVVKSKLKEPLFTYAVSVAPDAGIAWSFCLNHPIEFLIDLEWSINEALVDAFEDTLSDAFYIGVKPLIHPMMVAND